MAVLLEHPAGRRQSGPAAQATAIRTDYPAGMMKLLLEPSQHAIFSVLSISLRQTEAIIHQQLYGEAVHRGKDKTVQILSALRRPTRVQTTRAEHSNKGWRLWSGFRDNYKTT